MAKPGTVRSLRTQFIALEPHPSRRATYARRAPRGTARSYNPEFPTVDSPLVAALPTGRLLRAVAALLRRAGVPLPDGNADRRLRLQGNGMEVLFAKDRDVPIYVEHGVADFGVVGRDILEERPAHIYEPLDLGLGRCRMVLARPEGRPLPEPPLRIATKYPAVATRHFGARGIPIELIRLAGAIELAPTMDLADAVVDLVETGTTLRDNGLVEEETLFESSARVVVNRAAFRLRGPGLQVLLRRLETAMGET